MKLSNLLYPDEYQSSFDPERIEITRIVSDARSLSEGVLFICLRGTRFDSHTLLKKAEEAKAAAIITEIGSVYTDEISIPIFRVKSSRAALSLAHSRFHGMPERELTMIGVTGTNGKTSTATILYSILKHAGYRVALIGTAQCLYNDKIYTLPEEEGGGRLRTMTTPDPDILYPMLRLMRNEGITHVVMEVSSHSLVLEKLVPIKYKLSIFTNLSSEHMDFHGTMNAYMNAKSRLFQQSEIGILNCDDSYAEEIASHATCTIRRAGVVWRGEYRATDIELRGRRGITYSLVAPGIRLRIRSALPGAFSVYNTLLALVSAIELGISPIAASEALTVLATVPGRMERIPTDAEGSFTVFIDYAHTEAALRALLNTVRGFRCTGERIILLFGCGGNRDRTKRAPMGRAAEELADVVVLTSDNARDEEPKDIINDILAGMHTPEAVRIIADRRDAIATVIKEAQAGDIILLCGKGHETYEIDRTGIHEFDERKIVEKALKERNAGGY